MTHVEHPLIKRAATILEGSQSIMDAGAQQLELLNMRYNGIQRKLNAQKGHQRDSQDCGDTDCAMVVSKEDKDTLNGFLEDCDSVQELYTMLNTMLHHYSDKLRQLAAAEFLNSTIVRLSLLISSFEKIENICDEATERLIPYLKKSVNEIMQRIRFDSSETL